MSPVREITAPPTPSGPHASRTPRSFPTTISTARCVPAGCEDFVGQDAVKDQLAVSIAAAASRGEALDHVLLAGPPGARQDLAGADRRRRARGPVRADRRPGARAQGRRRGVPDRARAARGVLRRRDPPPAARARGDVLSGDGGRLPADHGRAGRRRARGDAAAAAVHADRRHDPRRADHDAAARPVRDPASSRALRRRRSGDDRPPLGAAARRRDRGRRRPCDRAAQPRDAARRQPAAQARPRLRRGARQRRRHRRGGDRRHSTCSRSTTPASTASTARSCARSARSSAAARSACRRSPSRSARSRTRSRTCTSPTCSSGA